MKELLRLFMTFFKIGAFTFGGGYAMLPIIQREVVENNKWVTEEEVLDYYAIGQSTPGIIAVNTSTFVGYRVRGIPGAIASTLGMVAPSIIIITILAAVLFEYNENKLVKSALGGVRVAVTALVLNTVIRMYKQSVRDTAGIIVFAAAFAAVLLFGISPLWVIGLSILFGLVYKKGGQA